MLNLFVPQGKWMRLLYHRLSHLIVAMCDNFLFHLTKFRFNPIWKSQVFWYFFIVFVIYKYLHIEFVENFFILSGFMVRLWENKRVVIRKILSTCHQINQITHFTSVIIKMIVLHFLAMRPLLFSIATIKILHVL